jgi:Tol biopolymer transport system component
LRYQHAADIRSDLKRLKRDTDSQQISIAADEPEAVTHVIPAARDSGVSKTVRPAATVESGTTPSSASVLPGEAKRYKTGVVIAGIMALVAIAAVSWLLYSQMRKRAPARTAQQMSIERLTYDGKTNGSTSVSADGKYVVYQVTKEGKRSLWLRQIATSSAVKLVPDTDNEFGGTTFSPDANFVYYHQVSKDEPSGALYVVPTLGSEPKKISKIDSPITFSPDGKQIAYVRGISPEGPTSQLVVTNADGSNIHPIVTGKVAVDWFDIRGPSWSSDGKLIAVGKKRLNKSGYQNGISLYDLSGKEAIVVEKLAGEVARMVWLNDGTGLVYSATLAVGATGNQIWFVSYPEGEVSRITHDLNEYGQISLGVTGDGSTIVTIQQVPHSNLWLSTGNYNDARQITQGDNDGFNSGDANNYRIVLWYQRTGRHGHERLLHHHHQSSGAVDGKWRHIA